MDKELEDVRAFHNRFGILDSGRVPTMLTKRKLQERIECMQEELDEFKKAVEAQDFPEQADALIDLVYFAKGTAVMMGLPWSDLWDDVQRANMSKVRGVGKRGHAVDMVKPYGWEGPKTSTILAGAGYNRATYMQGDEFIEQLCLDDEQGHKLFNTAVEIIKAKGGIVGDFMLGPVCVFSKDGKLEKPEGREEQVTVTAASRKGHVSTFEEDFAKLIDAGKIYHLFAVSVLNMWPTAEVGDLVDIVDPNTFTMRKEVITQEMLDMHNGIVQIRYGVNGGNI